VLKFAEAQWQLNPPAAGREATVTAVRRHDQSRSGDNMGHEARRRRRNRILKTLASPGRAAVVSLLRPSKDGRHLDIDKTVDLVIAQAVTTNARSICRSSVTKPDVSQTTPPTPESTAQSNGPDVVAGASPPKRANITLATQRPERRGRAAGASCSPSTRKSAHSPRRRLQLGWGIANAGTMSRPCRQSRVESVRWRRRSSICLWAATRSRSGNFTSTGSLATSRGGVEGLDAPVDEEANLDFKFINTDDNYLLIQAWVEDSKVVFGLYGTKPDWTVKSQPGERTDVAKASQIRFIEDEPTLPPASGSVEARWTASRSRTPGRSQAGRGAAHLAAHKLDRSSRNVVLVGTGGDPRARPR